MKKPFLWIAALIALVVLPAVCKGEENQEDMAPDRYGFALMTGTTYDPDNDIRLCMMSGFALYDYDRVWPHRAPEPLRFKVEMDMGAGMNSGSRFMGSVNILALYFADRFSNKRIRPYGEAGIGLIYTDFRVKGQGLRFNFNPQIGFGTEIKTRSGEVYFTAFRLHHISNANFVDDNRGVNSAIILFGRLYK
ncbi:MAG: acyloxyacyl hydrolase [Proteobacteria bacterium]|nr:acyloxyacyl hydrolase [Pseudomonadota bacterium]MBU4472079.1 acyloxyacyl hydrolase [Pseudomonadota bacterium]MCG2752922.1 acyloxyacyl hydrolase [Desulfobacteraceae bacterium]